ncbi:hypothetical protein BUZ94_13515 [Mammaliicoccus sciuri]|uniref:hypothetical protein n=1 Tax=Mammaliicoccus sciuri TaxID=1296 RepID=UPI000E6A8907|nr:hypothetical protein [Mammaliicoccus sciuri]RIO07072.1 hypothetical protein BUZ94_13515 [Mammaliicoccus sciuri]
MSMMTEAMWREAEGKNMIEYYNPFADFIYIGKQKENKLKRENVLKRKRLYARKPRKVNHGRCI